MASNSWGVRVLRDPTHIVYVWFDTLFRYVSGLLPLYSSDEVNVFDVQAHGWAAYVHIIGKYILRFHAVYWPAMLKSTGLLLPHKVVGHGFITKDGMKMGNSLGNVLDPYELCKNVQV